MTVSKDAPILPAVGIGGILLRTPIRELSSLLGGLGIRSAGDYFLAGLFDARYRLSNLGLEIAVDVRNGRVFRLTATAGYQGALFDRIRVGMQVAEAQRVEQRLQYSEAEEMLFVAGVSGVSLEVAEPDPPPTLVPQLTVVAISVFVPELDTAAGQRGDW